MTVQLVFGARIKAFHAWQAAEEKLRKAKAKRGGRDMLGLSVSEIAEVSSRLRSSCRSPTPSGLPFPAPEGVLTPPPLLPAQDGSLRLVFGHQAERRALDAKSDFEDVSKLTKAEMARFDKEKVDDFKRAVEDYAEGLARRQREVVNVWQAYTDLLMKATGTNSTPVLPGDAGAASPTD